MHRFYYAVAEVSEIPIDGGDEKAVLKWCKKKGYKVLGQVETRRETPEEKKAREEKSEDEGEEYFPFKVTVQGKTKEMFIDAPTAQEAKQKIESEQYRIIKSYGEVDEDLRLISPKVLKERQEEHEANLKTWAIAGRFLQYDEATRGMVNKDTYVHVNALDEDAAIEMAKKQGLKQVKSVYVWNPEEGRWENAPEQQGTGKASGERTWKVTGVYQGKPHSDEFKASSMKDVIDHFAQLGFTDIHKVEYYNETSKKWVNFNYNPTPFSQKGLDIRPGANYKYTAINKVGTEVTGEINLLNERYVIYELQRDGFKISEVTEIPGKKGEEQEEEDEGGWVPGLKKYRYEAMDHTGREVKDTISAKNQEEAQQLIRQKGFFVTKIQEVAKPSSKNAPGQSKGKLPSWIPSWLKPSPHQEFWYGRQPKQKPKSASLEQHANLIKDTLGMTRTADLVRQAARVAQAVQETVQTDQDIDPVVTTAVKQASQGILTVTDQLRQMNHTTTHRFAAQIEQDFVDSLSFPIGV